MFDVTKQQTHATRMCSGFTVDKLCACPSLVSKYLMEEDAHYSPEILEILMQCLYRTLLRIFVILFSGSADSELLPDNTMKTFQKSKML